LIDAAFHNGTGGARRVYHFETIPGAVWKPCVHHPQRIGGFAACENPAQAQSRTAKLRALAFA
jgi:hypothetical protein